MKNKKLIIMLITTLVIGVGIFLGINNLLEEDTREYVLEKYLSSDINIERNSKIIVNEGITFVKNINQLKIYDKNKNDITPSVLNNIDRINNVIVNDEFLGYIVSNNDQSYYINNKGEVVFNIKTSLMNNNDNYFIVDTDKVCHTSTFNNYSYEYKCQSIYDINGNLLIDGKENNYYNYVSYLVDGKTYFGVEKDGKTALIDDKNNIIIDFKEQYFTYNKNLNVIKADYNKHLNTDIYDIKGNLLKTITINEEYVNKNTMSFGAILDNSINYYFNDNIHLLNNDYELVEYKDIYFTEVPGMNDNGKLFYITNSIYIKDNNGVYTIHDLGGNKIIDEEFKYIVDAVSNGASSIASPDGYLVLCKNEDKTGCGAIDFNGNILLNFDNELYYSQYFNGFKNNNQYFNIINGKVTNKLNCDNFNMYINKYIDNVVIAEESFASGYKTGILDLNCNRLSEFKYLDIIKESNYLLAQTRDGYDIYDKNAKIINYENDDNVTLNYFLGSYDNNLYFSSNNDVYVLKPNNK